MEITGKHFKDIVAKERDGKWKVSQEEVDQTVYEADVFLGAKAVETGYE